ncbi:MAG TPA: hypothetical protein VGN82_04130 [Bosea sp. (in: a-proteobacteria)]|jgi:hypothetical protein|uniref:hypothetical protein n=1 Tax=Bosea sp. (in: a-proteobacteria) TaxID=1871050 RepID=UPI002E0D283E|nr:hypothetical protein [Bosea sp. (in: a-proteobacteria)]
MTATQNRDDTNRDEAIRLPNVTPARLNGRVDALDGNRLHGWIWDEARPEERLLVRVFCDGALVQESTADQNRIDLRRNGIGDGRHAFSMELDDAVVAARNTLTIVGVSGTTGVELELRLPPPAELAAEAAVAVPLARFFDRVEALIALNRRTQIAQKELGEKLDRIAAQLEQNRAPTRDPEADAAVEGQIGQRLAEIDVFQLRFDATLKSFDERLTTIRKEARAPLRQVTVILGFLSGLAAVMSFVTLAVLLVRR